MQLKCEGICANKTDYLLSCNYQLFKLKLINHTIISTLYTSHENESEDNFQMIN